MVKISALAGAYNPNTTATKRLTRFVKLPFCPACIHGVVRTVTSSEHSALALNPSSIASSNCNNKADTKWLTDISYDTTSFWCRFFILIRALSSTPVHLVALAEIYGVTHLARSRTV